MSAGWTVETNGDVALTAATAKTIVNWVAASNHLAKLVEISVGFDGVTLTAEPVTVELVRSTQAGAGTSTAHTPLKTFGQSADTVKGTARRAYTAEPTVLTVIKRWLVHPAGGQLVMQFPLGREPEIFTVSQAMGIRCTAPATVNVQGYMEFEE